MACIKDILAAEELHNDENTIRLYAEGVFYKAYEYSAYLFVHHIRSYRVKRKYYKSVHGDVVSTGFPISALATLPLPAGCIPIEEPNSQGKVMLIPISQDTPGAEVHYDSWRESIPLLDTAISQTVTLPGFADSQPDETTLSPSSSSGHDSMYGSMARLTVTSTEKAALEKLRNFQLEAATPMRCMLFVAELRQMMAGHGCDERIGG